jgi:hypothetical protein
MTIESGGTRTAWRRVTSRRDQKIAHRAWGNVPQQRNTLRVFRVDHQLTPLDVFPLLLPPVALCSFHLCPPLCATLLTYSTRFYSIAYPFTSLQFLFIPPTPPYTAHPVELETCNCIPIIHSLTTHPSRPASDHTHDPPSRRGRIPVPRRPKKNSHSRSKRKNTPSLSPSLYPRI